MQCRDAPVIADDFVHDGLHEPLAEIGVEALLHGELAQPVNLGMLACQIDRRQPMSSLVLADLLRDSESLRKHSDQFGVHIVDATAVRGQLVVRHRTCF